LVSLLNGTQHIKTGFSTPDTRDWQRALSRAIRDPDELIDRLGLPEGMRPEARAAAKLFPLLVPESFIERMNPGDPHDPLLLQVLPLGLEMNQIAGFDGDPVGDAQARSAPGLLQKYRGRALLIAAGACAVHCRYCFRRHYPYGEEPRRLDDWEPAFAAIESDPDLREVILSGGDPLMLSDARLALLVERISRIAHVSRLRIHTRLPIVLPERMTAALISLLQSAGPTPILVVHANHPREIVGRCAEMLRHAVRSGLTVLNQSVLLKGINDSVEALAGLSEALVDLGVIPYYLHQLDRVAGAAHFEVPASTGLALVAALRERLPGYAIPRYVREVAGEAYKVEVQVKDV
jgi:EF-P beta-lysylation protein EpmB